MVGYVLDFEKPVIELEQKIEEMKETSVSQGMDLSEEIDKLYIKLENKRKEIFSNLTSWEKVQLARHPDRPYPLDYISRITDSFIELHGDRAFADDKAIVSGLGVIDNYNVVINGQQRGRDTKTNIYHNFGMPNPEGFRKSIRIMKLAAKFGKPIINFIDTKGAYPGKGAEERGIAEAIAKNLFEMAMLPVPIIVVVIGEGGSGGALGLGLGDRVMMLENSVYSVISPEGCASILYRDSGKAPNAADAMKVSAPDLVELGLVDKIIPEPPGGAHRNYGEAAKFLKTYILSELESLVDIEPEQLVAQRIEKFGKMGFWEE